MEDLHTYLHTLKKHKKTLTRGTSEYKKIKSYISIVKEMITMEPPKQKRHSRHTR